MNKKFLSLVLALVMVLGTFGNVFAATATDKEDGKDVPKLTSIDSKVQWLIDNKIVIGAADANGNATGDMELDKPIRRDAVAKMLVYAIKEQDYAAKLQGVYRPFPDVALDNVMNGYIAVGASKTSPANNLPFIIGYEDGLFRPTKEVTYAELAKMLVVTIDEDLTKAKADNYKWTQDWVNRAVQLGIFDGLSVDDVNAKAVRKDAFAMIYNAFYELKDVKPVPANEMRGVISESSDGTELVLNQGDYKTEYKVDKNTVFVTQDGRTQKWISNTVVKEDYYVGSVVRVLSDDGVATHVIEMGNPEDGIQNRKTAWVDLGNKTLRLIQSSNWKATSNDVKLGDDVITLKGKDFETSNKTEFYVADYDEGILTKVKDYDAAKDIVADDDDMTAKVYLAYEVLPKSGVNEARVVVFNKADNADNNSLVRASKVVSSPNYLLEVQAPGEEPTEVKSYSLRDLNNEWPYNYNLENDDVFKLVYAGNDFKRVKDLKIDASNAPVYKIVDYLLVENGTEKSVERAKANTIELKDIKGNTTKFDLPKEYDAFFGNQATKGAHVQIALKDGTHGEKGVASDDYVIDIISVVNRDLKGQLKDSEESGIIKGYFVNYSLGAHDSELPRVEVVLQDTGETVSLVTNLPKADFPEKGAYVELRVDNINNDYSKAEIVKVLDTMAETDAVEAVDDLIDTLDLNKKNEVKGTQDNREILGQIIDAYDKVYDENGEKKAQINDLIKEYNNNNGNLNDLDLL